MPLVRYRCVLCGNTADGELDVIGKLCVDCCDLVVERMFALLEVPAYDRRAILARLPALTGDDATRPEPINWRRWVPRTRAERRRAWREAGLLP